MCARKNKAEPKTTRNRKFEHNTHSEAINKSLRDGHVLRLRIQ